MLQYVDAIDPDSVIQESCPQNQLPVQYPKPNQGNLVDLQNEGRLMQYLRDLAQTKDPVKILSAAAAAMLTNQQELGLAIADLAVTGQASFAIFRQKPLTDADLIPLVQAQNQAFLAQVPKAVAAVLDRAYQVVLALRGTVSERAQTRPPLGWIAVSGEDDAPHRPVNVPGPPFPQYDLPVPCQGKTVQTRYMIASPWPDPSAANPGGRTIPADPVPIIPERDSVIIFLAGQDSSIEECLPLVNVFHKLMIERGVGYTIIAMDLPCSGYASMIDHAQIANIDASNRYSSPILDFIEDFIVNFVDELDKKVNIKKRIVGVIGGSLGGNMGMRLGQRDLNLYPWLKNIVAWSPGSIWESFEKTPQVNEGANAIAVEHCTDGMNAEDASNKNQEAADYRRLFIQEVFDQIIPIVGHTQPEMWYRDQPPWEPCKTNQILGARMGHREIYNWVFRRWHWRVGLEELVFSVRDPKTRQGQDLKYLSIRSNMLLASGEQDDYTYAHIYTRTQEVAKLMANTPGRTLFLKNTGHSIHFERPELFARQIADFLPVWSDPSIYSNQLKGVWNIWANGFTSTLNVTSVDEMGNVRGIMFQNAVSGFWDEESRALTLLRMINPSDPSTCQVYTGYLFADRDDAILSLAGSFEAFVGTGASATQSEFGWYARQQVVS